MPPKKRKQKPKVYCTICKIQICKSWVDEHLKNKAHKKLEQKMIWSNFFSNN